MKAAYLSLTFAGLILARQANAFAPSFLKATHSMPAINSEANTRSNSKLNMIRTVTAEDVPELKNIIDATELFPSEMLDGMLSNHLSNRNTDESGQEEIWLTGMDENEEKPVCILYCKQEQMTEGTWNALWLAVNPESHGKGHGSKIMAFLEELLKERGQRILLVETSGNDEFAGTRKFYEKIGYEEEGRIREYYQAGEDKIIYRKAL